MAPIPPTSAAGAAAGLAAGFAAAFLQSCSYVVSSRYVRESGRPAWTLLPPSFLLMGLAALPLLAAVRPADPAALAWRPALEAATLSTLFCLAANAAMFFLLKHADSSRASPLLALKVPMLAAFWTFGLGRPCSAAQWLGVALVVAAAALLAGAGRRLSRAAWGWLLATCAGYCVADWYIVRTFEAVAPAFPGFLARSLFSLALIYAVTGAASAALLPFCRSFGAADWRRHALPYAALWFAAMVVLYVCFASCGLVLGNIVQSTRGLISVGLGWLVARAGRTDLEERVGSAVFARRVFAALLLVAAVALYAAG